jgi:hypothetical protein
MKRTMINSILILFLLSFSSAQSTSSQVKKGYHPQQEPPPPRASVNPYSIDFKDQVVKKASKPQRITLTNSGGKPLYINSAVLEGDHKDDFSMPNDTCTGATIAPGKSCVIDVRITPSITGYRKATITVTDNAVDSPQHVELIGNGINSVRVPPSGSR